MENSLAKDTRAPLASGDGNYFHAQSSTGDSLGGGWLVSLWSGTFEFVAAHRKAGCIVWASGRRGLGCPFVFS